jgi:hypothetical protein
MFAHAEQPFPVALIGGDAGGIVEVGDGVDQGRRTVRKELLQLVEIHPVFAHRDRQQIETT